MIDYDKVHAAFVAAMQDMTTGQLSEMVREPYSEFVTQKVIDKLKEEA